MANILYGVNGEGSGHSTRAKEVISHLQQQGHTVHSDRVGALYPILEIKD